MSTCFWKLDLVYDVSVFPRLKTQAIVPSTTFPQRFVGCFVLFVVLGILGVVYSRRLQYPGTNSLCRVVVSRTILFVKSVFVSPSSGLPFYF